MINRASFLNVYHNQLTPDQKEILPLFLAGLNNKDIAEKELRVTPTAVSHRLKSIAKKFDCPDGQRAKTYLIELFVKYKPELVGSALLEDYPEIIQPHLPDRPEPINSPFYIERDDFESNLDTLLTQCLIRVTGPKKMGKTSFLKRIMAHSKLQKFESVYVNLSQIEESKLQSESEFIRLFYNLIIQELLSLSPNNEWDQNLSAMTNCTSNFQSLLKKLNQTFVLILDEVDHLLAYPRIYRNFFPLLRHWYEKSSDSDTWRKLKMIIAYSTEDYGKLDIDQSPFNIGLAIKLKEFSPLQVQNLASRHRLNREEILPLIDLVGGHPFLIRLAFYHLFYNTITLQHLLKEAATDAGIYRQHLLRLLRIIKTNTELEKAFNLVLNSHHVIEPKQTTIPLYQLESMGLIKLEGNTAKVSCQLYSQYFKHRLG